MLTINKRLNCLIFGLVMLTLAACSSLPEGPQETGDDQEATPQSGSLDNTQWTLVSFGQTGAETAVIEGSSITLEFDDEGRAGGSGGCNSYGGQYEVQGNTLSFGEFTQTLMACQQEGIDQQEQAYFKALGTAVSFELSGDQLTIAYDGGQLNWIKSGVSQP